MDQKLYHTKRANTFTSARQARGQPADAAACAAVIVFEYAFAC